MQTQKIQSVEVKSRTDFRNLDKFDTYTKNGIYFINDLYDVTHTKEGESEFIARPYINPYYGHKRPLLRDGYYFQSKDNKSMIKEYTNFGSNSYERKFNIRRDIASEFRPFHTFHFTDETGWYGITDEEIAGQEVPTFTPKQYIWFATPPFDYVDIRKHQRRKRYYVLHNYMNTNFRNSSFSYDEGFARRVNMGFKGLNYRFIHAALAGAGYSSETTPTRKNLYVMANANFAWDNNTGLQFLQATTNDKPDNWVNKPNTDFNGNNIDSMEELRFDFQKKYGLTYEEYKKRIEEKKVNADRGKWGFGGNEFYNGSAPGYMYSTKGGYPSFLNGNSSGSSSYKSFFEKSEGYIDPTEDFLVEAMPVYTAANERDFTGEQINNSDGITKIKNAKGTLEVMKYFTDEDGILQEDMMANMLKDFVRGAYIDFYDYDNPISELETRVSASTDPRINTLDWMSEMEVPSTQYRVLENYLVEEGLIDTTISKNSNKTIEKHPLHTEYTYSNLRGDDNYSMNAYREVVPSYYRISESDKKTASSSLRDYMLSTNRRSKINKNISPNIFKYGNGFLDYDNVYFKADYRTNTASVSDYYSYHKGIQRNKVYDDLLYEVFCNQYHSLFKAEGIIDLVKNKYSSGQTIMDRMPLTYTQTWDGNIYTPANTIRKALGSGTEVEYSYMYEPFGNLGGYSVTNYDAQYYSIGAYSNSYFMSYGPNTSQMLIYTPSIIYSTTDYITKNEPKYKKNGIIAIKEYKTEHRQSKSGTSPYNRATASYDDIFAKLGVLFVMGTENYMLQKFVNREYTFYRYRIDGKWTNWKHDYPQGSTHLSNIDFYDNSEAQLNVLSQPLGDTHFSKISDIYDVDKYSKILESVKYKNLNWTNINYAMGFGAFGQQYSEDGIDNLRPKGRLYHEHDIFDYLGYHPLSRKFDFTTDDAIIQEADDVLIRDLTVANLYLFENGDFTVIPFLRQGENVKMVRNGPSNTYKNQRETQGIKYRIDKKGPNYDLVVVDKSNPMKLIVGNSEEMNEMKLCSKSPLSTMVKICDNTSGLDRNNWNKFIVQPKNGNEYTNNYIWNNDRTFLGRTISKYSYESSKFFGSLSNYKGPEYGSWNATIMNLEERKFDNKYLPDVLAYNVAKSFWMSIYFNGYNHRVEDRVETSPGGLDVVYPVFTFLQSDNKTVYKQLSRKDSEYMLLFFYHINNHQKSSERINYGPILNNLGTGRQMNLPSYRGLNINEGATKLSDIMTDFNVLGNKINDYPQIDYQLYSDGLAEQFQYMIDNPDNPDVQIMLKDMHDKNACIYTNSMPLYSYESKGKEKRDPIVDRRFPNETVISILDTTTNKYRLVSYQIFEKYMNTKYGINIHATSTVWKPMPINWNIISLIVKENYYNH